MKGRTCAGLLEAFSGTGAVYTTAIVHLFSAEEPDRLRGPNLDGLWIDELCAMSNAETCWDMAQMALRIPGPLGDAPCCAISTTPKSLPILKQIIAASSTVVTRARTSDNAANLDTSTLAYLHDKYGGSRLGRRPQSTLEVFKTADK